MCDCCGNFDFTELDEFLKTYGGAKGNLIAVLQKAQDIYGYLPEEVITRISLALRIAPAKIIGVATFYTQFRMQKAGKYLILLCQGTACHVNGSAAIEEAVISFLSENCNAGKDYREGDTTADGIFTLKNVACLGCCSLSPVMMINGETYGSLTPESAKQILKKTKDSADGIAKLE
ncbi:MAG: NAD(P)H-dependent oxidoreductase subunit E [Clostridiales bacterium]|jgi:NADH-quinone oxidoreductase subunit E|nr:NAD(P)H-dependent oxidoreductase subunit E [Clostridiales bacterium]